MTTTTSNYKFTTTGVLLRVILIAPIFSSLILSSSSSSTTKSFRVDFIRRDSPRSPLHNSSQTQYERVRAAFSRSSKAMKRFQSSPMGTQSKLYPNTDEFLMELSIGTPPLKLLATVDTGSDLTWTNCKPCNKCYTQTQPMFNPNSSSTYRSLSCVSDRCLDYDPAMSCGNQKECRYQYSYEDKSYTIGLLSSETLTFSSSSGEPVSFLNTTMGCAHESVGLFDPSEGGLVGLGGGPLSIIFQLGPSIDHKFSYCLVPYSHVNSSSTFTFGPATNVAGLTVVSTPLLPGKVVTYYNFFLKSIVVGNTSIQVGSSETESLSPNFIIDSGTTETYLPSTVLTSLTNVISGIVKLTPAKDPEGEFPLCYNLSSGSLETSGLPDIKLNMANDATVTLPPANTFVQVDDGIICLAMGDAGASSLFILGNVAQQNFLIEYDIGKKLLSFAPMDCTKY